MRVARILLLVLSVLFAAALAGEPEQTEQADPLAVEAAVFGKLFLDGDYDAIHERMDASMRAAVPRDRAEQIRADLLNNGAVDRVGDAWLEAVDEDYRRYRVPVYFESAALDLRVVYDTDGKVTGFFYVPHVEPSAERVATHQEAAPEFLGHWEGSIETPGTALTVQIDLRYAKGYWSGTADIPQQGAKGLPLAGIRPAGDEIEFGLADIPGNPAFKGKLAEGEIRGQFTQGGQSFAFSLRRGELPPPARPQEPKPPFPYEEQEVSYTHGDITLAGTLTFPSTGGPFPAVVLISGSGPQDRNEEIFEHKPFLVLADDLTRAGIAVLRVDDRGVGGSTGSISDSTSEDFASDVRAGITFLKSRDEIDAERIGLIGHSEGGIVAPLVAASSDDVAFVVMLAGTGVPGQEVLTHQIGLISRAGGADEAAIEAILTELDTTIALITSGADEERLRAQMRKLLTAQLGPMSPEDLDAAVNKAMLQMNSVWFRSFLPYDPRPALREIKVPVLVLNGEKDLQVDPEQNVPEIRKALDEGGNTEYTVTVLPGLNHLFQKSETGAPQEYYTIEETINPAALDAVRDWIVQRFGKRTL